MYTGNICTVKVLVAVPVGSMYSCTGGRYGKVAQQRATLVPVLLSRVYFGIQYYMYYVLCIEIDCFGFGWCLKSIVRLYSCIDGT